MYILSANRQFRLMSLFHKFTKMVYILLNALISHLLYIIENSYIYCALKSTLTRAIF